MEAVIIIAVCVFFLVAIVVGCYCFATRWFVVDRTKIVLLSAPLKYLAERPIEEPEVFLYTTSVTKTDRQRIHARRDRAFMASKRPKVWPKGKKKRSQVAIPDKQSNSFGFCCIRYCTHVVETGEAVEEEESDDDDEIDELNKKKRFISEDGLAKREKRSTLYGKKEEVIDIEDDGGIEVVSATSLHDLESLRDIRTDHLISDRVEARKQKKKSFVDAGGIDAVATNSGPPPEKWPKGYRPSKVVPTIDDSLLKKRVMYLWEGNARCTGWFLGSISSVSRMKGFNYNVKYDRSETKNVFVDGIENCDLSLTGEDAYGRRWIILEKDDEETKEENLHPLFIV